jgi:hypothetical protein
MDDKPASMVTSYGRLDKILVCKLSHHQIYRSLCNKVLILALIVPCKTNGQDASISIVGYKQMMAPVVTDIRNIKAVVGRVLTWGENFIIDHTVKPSGELAFGDTHEEFPELGNWSDNTSDTD